MALPAPRFTRRDLLRRCGMGLGPSAWPASSTRPGSWPPSRSQPARPEGAALPRQGQAGHPLFMNGGPSHVDTFDPKPLLTKYDGKALPTANLPTERKTGAAFPSPFKFQKYGESGIEVSELFANTAKHIDDICVIRSMHADVPNHEPSLLLMNCGEARLVRPSMGSWVTYGLGTENQNLPGFIAMCPGGYPIQEIAELAGRRSCPASIRAPTSTRSTPTIEKLIENIRNKSRSPTRRSGGSSICCSS